MSTASNETRYEHVIEALQRLGDNAAAAALIRLFEEQRRCPDQNQAAQEPAGATLVPTATLGAVNASSTSMDVELQHPAARVPAQTRHDEPGQADLGARDDSEQESCAAVVPNPAQVRIDTVDVASEQADAEKPGKVALARSGCDSAQAQQMPSSATVALPHMTSLSPAKPVGVATPAGTVDATVANDYVTLAQFVAFLAAMPGDNLIKNGGLIRVATIVFDVTRVTADAVTFGHDIKASHTHDISDGSIALTRSDFNAISLDGNTATAQRLCSALAPLAAINPTAGVCIADNAVKLEGAFSFATDNTVRFHNTSLNPAHVMSERGVIRDAIAFASRCVELGISCGEVLSMLARRIPTHARMGVLHLVALDDRVVTGKQITRLFQSASFIHADVPGDLFAEVEPTGDCPAGFKNAPHISMGRLRMSWDELEATIIDEDEFGDLDGLPRCAGGRPWTLPLF